jgi:aminomethyltransferase
MDSTPRPEVTPLHPLHVELGARMAPFAGFDMPIQYEGILAEHHATRTAATVFDTCHMGRLLISGPGAGEDLSALLTQEVRSLREGRCRYGFLLREDGGILDDQILYRFGPAEFMLVVNAGTRRKDLQWILAHIGPTTSVRDISESVAKVDVQGPASPGPVSALIDWDAAGLPRFGFRRAPWTGGGTVTVSRSGYTGEDGFELYLPAEHVAAAWRELLRLGVKPAGLGARDTLRLEAGLPLYGHELTEQITPVEAAMERYASKPSAFIGAEAVRARQSRGAAIRRVGLRTGGRQTARSGNPVLAGSNRVGWVTSGSFAPTLGCSIALAFVETEALRSCARFAIDSGRKVLEADVTPLPFYRRQP